MGLGVGPAVSPPRPPVKTSTGFGDKASHEWEGPGFGRLWNPIVKGME